MMAEDRKTAISIAQEINIKNPWAIWTPNLNFWRLWTSNSISNYFVKRCDRFVYLAARKIAVLVVEEERSSQQANY